MQLILTESPRTARRASGLGVSLVVHGLVVVLLVSRAVQPGDANSPVDLVAVTLRSGPPPAPRSGPVGDWDVAEFPPSGDPELRFEEHAFDTAKIAARREALFPFLTFTLAFLDRATDAMEIARRQLVNPYVPPLSSDSRPPLDIGAAAVQRYVDRSWSRRGRWRAFTELKALIEAHHPDAGRVPDLLQEYVSQNILQPFCDAESREPRYWTMLENAADHADFLQFTRSVLETSPSSRASTHLLFLLDKLVTANRDALLLLLETDVARGLPLTAVRGAEAHALAGGLQQRYGGWLRMEGLESLAAIRERYDEVRLRLLATIVEVTPAGYRSGDARFLAGSLALSRGDLDEALRWWRPIVPDPSDAYVVAYSQALDVIEGPGPIDTRRLARIVQNVHGRWRVFSIDRLRQFGHACDTY